MPQAPCPKPSQASEVIHAVEHMWVARDAKRRAAPAKSFWEIAEAYRRAEACKHASKALRTASRAARQAWFEKQISAAEAAARKNDLGGVYRVINAIAPKKRREQVQLGGSCSGQRRSLTRSFSIFKGVLTVPLPLTCHCVKR